MLSFAFKKDSGNKMQKSGGTCPGFVFKLILLFLVNNFSKRRTSVLQKIVDSLRVAR